jgi:hypothetical protein
VPCGAADHGGIGTTPHSVNAAPAATYAAPAKLFRPILSTLRRTRVPLLLPTLTSLNRYHASIVESGAGHYDVFLGYVPNCLGDACEYGELIAKKLGRGAHGPSGARVALTGGVTGYYVGFTCGASCGASTVTTDVRGYRYVYGIKAVKRSEVVRMADSALKAGPA